MSIGPRRINEWRRMAVPQRQAKAVGIVAGGRCRSARCNDRGALMIRPHLASPRPTGDRRDPNWPRRVSLSGQVTLPAVLLAAPGLDIGDWVAFSAGRSGLRLYSAQRVRAMPAGVKR